MRKALFLVEFHRKIKSEYKIIGVKVCCQGVEGSSYGEEQRMATLECQGLCLGGISFEWGHLSLWE